MDDILDIAYHLEQLEQDGIPDFPVWKFNPYHDDRGRFDTADGGGMAAPGQPELPGIGVLQLNPGAFNQPQMFGMPQGGLFTTPITVVGGAHLYPSTIPVDQLATATLVPMGGAVGEGGDNPRFSATVDGTQYFVKSMESRILGADASSMVENELGARAAAVAVGLSDQTVPVATFTKQGENAWGQSYDAGTYVAQPFINRQSGIEMEISLDENGDSTSGSGAFDAGEDISNATDALAKIDSATLSTMIGYEYAMGTGDRHEGQYLFDATAGANQTIMLNDFDAGFHQGTYQQPSYLANLANYAGRMLNASDLITLSNQSKAMAVAMSASGMSKTKIGYALERLAAVGTVGKQYSGGQISLSDFQNGVTTQ